MYIVNQKRNRIYNIDQFQQVCAKENNIQCKWGSELCIIATYKDAERAKEVFSQMIGQMFPSDMLIIQDMEVSEDVKNVIKDMPILVVKTPDNEPKVTAARPCVWYMPEA